MAITRILVFGSLLARIGATDFAVVCAAEPCCGWIGGKYINLKTGKAVAPPKDTHPPGPVGSANPQQDDVIIIVGPPQEPKRATGK